MENKIDWNQVILIATGTIIIVILLRQLKKVFAGDDGKLNVKELKEMAAFLFFLCVVAYMIYKEGNRTLQLGEHVFSELWVISMLTTLLIVLNLGVVLDKGKDIIEMVQKLKSLKKDKTSENSENLENPQK